MEIIFIIIAVGFALGMIATFLMIKILLKRNCHGEFKFCKECEFLKSANLEKFNEKFDLPDQNKGIFSDLDEIEV